MDGNAVTYSHRDGGLARLPGGGCLDGVWGAACFRQGSLPIIIHFTDACQHNGPPSNIDCAADYRGVTPAPPTWPEVVEVLNARGAKYIGISVSGSPCEILPASAFAPCIFMQELARATRTVDIEGRALRYSLPDPGDRAEFSDTIVEAVETVATRVPLDIDTAVRDEPDPSGVDAGQFVKIRTPGCRAAPASSPCWWPPEGTAHEDAVSVVDDSAFIRVVPGTRVLFRVTFQNDTYPGGSEIQVFVAFIDVRGDGAAILDTRQVFIVVPGRAEGGLI
jgi:hypothetical protein